MQETVLRGEKAYLRPMTREDTDLIVGWRNNPRVRENFIYRKPLTREDHLAWIENKVKRGEVIQFIICERGTDRPVGSVYFRDISREHSRAEYGIFIGEDDAVGHGIGSEVCKLACAYGFTAQGWHKIVLRALADNAAAIRTYEKAGFKREAYLKDEVRIDGVYRDVVLMGLLTEPEKTALKSRNDIEGAV